MGRREAVVVPCSDLAESVDTIKSELGSTGFRVATLSWTGDIPPLDSFIDETLNGLARLSLAVWPDWEISADEPSGSPSEPAPGKPSRIWREAAALYCAEGRLPLPMGYQPAVQVSQLASTLGADKLAIVITAEQSPDESVATVLRAAADWLAANASAPVMLLLPRDAFPGSGLEKLIPTVHLFGEPADDKDAGSRNAVRDNAGASVGTAQPLVDIFPVTGTPHPLSIGEKKLAERLLADPELSPLFEFNQRLKGRHGNEYIVDLVWRQGKLVIEVDSFQVHGNRYSFASDRHRDYELMAAGFRVLRITDDEAVGETASAIEKIRQLVRMPVKQ